MPGDSAEIQRILTKMDGFQTQITDVRERLTAAEVHRGAQLETLNELKDRINRMAAEIDDSTDSAKEAVQAARDALAAAQAALAASKATEVKIDALAVKLAVFERVAVKLDTWDPEKARSWGRVEWGGIATVIGAFLTGGTALAAQIVSIWNGHAPPPPPPPQPITLEAPAPDQGTSDAAGVDP